MIAAVVLAAGPSTRLGRPKQLVEYRGVTLLSHAVRCARAGGCEPVVTVLGAHAERLRGEAEAAGARVVVNESWREGLGSSVSCGVAAIAEESGDLRGVLLMAVDQPRITPDVVRALRERFETGRSRLLACAYGEGVGVPAVFDRSLFPELRALAGSRGAKPLLEAHADDLAVHPWPEGAFDIDTPEDVASLGDGADQRRRQ